MNRILKKAEDGNSERDSNNASMVPVTYHGTKVVKKGNKAVRLLGC